MVVVGMRADEPRLAVYKADRGDRISEGTIVRRLGKRRVSKDSLAERRSPGTVAHERDRAFT